MLEVCMVEDNIDKVIIIIIDPRDTAIEWQATIPWNAASSGTV